MKRKVISRGGHYIIRSKSSQGSPWSSGGSGYNFYTLRKNKKKQSGSSSGSSGIATNLRKYDNADVGGSSPYSSNTARRIDTLNYDQPKSRMRISKNLKSEIGQYALKNGIRRAIIRYEKDVGRLLKDRQVEKFVKRYQERMIRRRKHKRHLRRN